MAQIKYGNYVLEIYNYTDACKLNNGGVFVFATKLKSETPETDLNSWGYCFIGETDSFKKLENEPLWSEAKNIGGATHVHILAIADETHRKFYVEQLVNFFGYNAIPFINQRIQSENYPISPRRFVPSVSKETETKLELLYKYEKHYLELIKDYKEEIKFANSLQEDLRRERSQFFTQILKDVIQTMKTEEVDKSISAKWIQELVASYTKSIDLSSDLAKTHVIEILSILTTEAKQEAAEAKLDAIGKKENAE